MHKFFLEFKNLNKNTFKIMKYGLYFSAFVCLIAVCFLLLYIFIGSTFFYYLGLTLIQSGFTFAVEFVICGIVVDFIINHDF